MENNLRENFKIIAREYCGNEPVHGMPHVERMLLNFKKIRSENNVSQKILDATEVAVIFHDIGKNLETKEKKHGTISKEILESNHINILNKISQDECEWMKYAIDGHTNGMEIGKLKILESFENICLALLLALDNMDAIGEIGIHRDFQDLKDKFMKLGDERKENEKQEYFLDRLLRNYFRIDANIFRLEKIKEVNVERLIEHYKGLKNSQEEYILKLIRRELKVKDEDIERVLAV